MLIKMHMYKHKYNTHIYKHKKETKIIFYAISLPVFLYLQIG